MRLLSSARSVRTALSSATPTLPVYSRLHSLTAAATKNAAASPLRNGTSVSPAPLYVYVQPARSMHATSVARANTNVDYGKVFIWRRCFETSFETGSIFLTNLLIFICRPLTRF